MKIAILDLETDPFLYGRIPEPFACGIYHDGKFVSFWRPDCIERAVKYLDSLSGHYVIYAHNGGKFDWFFFLEYLRAELRIINGRIVQARLGRHEIRDSFSILPFKLADYQKDHIDYGLFEKEIRELHRDEILEYLSGDCRYLYELVSAFWDEFGDVLTVGSAAMRQIKQFHKFDQARAKEYDVKFRDNFYYGGRNQVFRAGIINRPIKIYDVNSMYPDVMRRFLHPVSTAHTVDKRIGRDTCFITAEGQNHGAFPRRQKDGSLSFAEESGVFHCSIHEWNAALETDTFRPGRIIRTYNFLRRDTFADFVDTFYAARKRAKSAGDAARVLFYKFVLNSGYGKFAQNPENFSEWQITGMESVPEPWQLAYIHANKWAIWKQPTTSQRYYNIATGASITGAARAQLLRGICGATNPMYCDTDSIICESLSGVDLDDNALGAWKLEGSGNSAAIAGKKLYAVTQGTECIKKAHKGARLEAEEIYRIARGEIIECVNPVPAFKFNGNHEFTRRKIRRTA